MIYEVYGHRPLSLVLCVCWVSVISDVNTTNPNERVIRIVLPEVIVVKRYK